MVGVCTLKKILPELCEKADLERKTAHSLHITCASRLFQSSVEEKLAQGRTGHRSNALFGYQKSSADQVNKVSEVLGPSINNHHKEVMPFGDALNDTILDNIVANSPLPEPDTVVDNFFENSVSDDILANIPLPEPDSVVDNLFENTVRMIY